jgi:predicted P-loop ATPase
MATMSRSELHEAALEYARQGMAVFPCKVQGKTPITRSGFKEATTDTAQINRWWSATPNANIGIATGSLSRGLLVVDLDVDDDKGINGYEALLEWQRESGITLPETAQSITGRGGYHMYYKTDRATKSRTAVIEGVDVRGDGGYVIAPPSIHKNGKRYEWESPIDEAGIAEADTAVFRLVNSGIKEAVAGARIPKGKKMVVSGNRNDTMFREVCAWQTQGIDDDLLWAYAAGLNAVKFRPPLADDELEKIIESAKKYPKGVQVNEDGSTIQYLSFRRHQPKPGEDKGRIVQSIANCRIVLDEDEALAGRIRYNELTCSITVSGRLPWSPCEEEREWDNGDDSNLAAYMERYGLTRSEYIQTALDVTARATPYHPIREWLQALIWDGEERMDCVFAKYLGCTMSYYNIEVQRLFLYGCVARALRPGIKFDYVPVLVGGQGKGKSLFFRKLSINEIYFNDNLNTFEGDKAAEKLRGIWIAELGELLALKRASDVQSFKAFITSTVDIYRPPYGRRTEMRPRSSVFVGTTNDNHFLTDTTGNRRFLPMTINPERVHPSDILEGWDQPEVTDFMSQVWAEAYHRYITDNPRLVLPKEIQNEAISVQERYTEDDPFVGVIARYLDTRDDETYGQYVCVMEILKEVFDNTKPTRREINNIHDILQTKIASADVADVVAVKPVGKQRCKQFGIQRAYFVESCREDGNK